METVSPSYFAVMSIGLRDGRVFTDSDGDGAQPGAVIRRSLASRYFAGENPLGKKVQVPASKLETWLTVVGIVDDVRYNWIQKDALPTLYRPYRQNPTSYTTVSQVS